MTGKKYLIIGISVLATTAAVLAFGIPKAMADDASELKIWEEYRTDVDHWNNGQSNPVYREKYRAWLQRQNDKCLSQFNPLEDQVGYWDCLEADKISNPPPEPA